MWECAIFICATAPLSELILPESTYWIEMRNIDLRNSLLSLSQYYGIVPVTCPVILKCRIAFILTSKMNLENQEKDNFNINSLLRAVAQINIAHTHIYLFFQYCLEETTSQYKGVHDCFL